MKERSCNVNGIDIYSLTNPYLNSFCISVYVRAGVLFEDASDNGISHLLEHVLFRHLKSSYSENFYDLLAMNGLSLDACTYKEFLMVSIDGPVSGIDFAIDLLCKMLCRINISHDEFNREKSRIKAEIREKDERYSLDYIFKKSVWQGTNAEKNILGCCSTINRISLKKLNEFRDRAFSEGNFFVYVTGNVSDESIETLKSKLFGLQINRNAVRFKNEVLNTDKFFKRNSEIKIKPHNWHYIKIGFDVDTRKHSGGVHDLIYAVLFRGDNSLVYTYLSEDNPLIYSYDSAFEQYNNIGNLDLKFEIEENRTEEAFRLIVQILNDLKSGKFSFEANYKCELASWRMLLDNPKDLNWSMAYYNHILESDKIDYTDDSFGRLKGITKEQVMQAAKEIFVPENISIAIKGSKRNVNVNKINEIISDLSV